jgi:chromate reductase, NAD(P)H dehydrogenase (quinone)
MKTILAVCGSTRQNSINLELLHIINDLFKEQITLKIFTQIAELPHFNPDLDNENPPVNILEFRDLLRKSDAILICTPEYAMGVPGTLKNALDWTVSSMEFSHKPTALITASSLGEKGHPALMETLKVIESDIDEITQLLIPVPRTKIKDGIITDAKTYKEVMSLMRNLIQKIA